LAESLQMPNRTSSLNDVTGHLWFGTALVAVAGLCTPRLEPFQQRTPATKRPNETTLHPEFDGKSRNARARFALPLGAAMPRGIFDRNLQRHWGLQDAVKADASDKKSNGISMMNDSPGGSSVPPSIHTLHF
jgi:hypothetical protein